MTRLKSDEIAVPVEEYERMRFALQRSGWQHYKSLGEIQHYDHRDEFVQAAIARKGGVLDALDEVIDQLGIRDSYEDVVTHEIVVDAHPDPPYEIRRQITRTDRGAQRFLDDIRAAKTARESSAAADRLTAALKRAH